MEWKKDLRTFFLEEQKKDEEQSRALQKSFDRIAWLRLLVFLAAVVLLYMGLTKRLMQEVYLIGGFLAIGGFLVLIRLHDGIEKKQRMLAARIAAVEAYPARLGTEWRNFPEDGGRYLQKNDTVCRDLDLLGPGSLYQLISICQSAYGKWRLADVLKDPYSVVNERTKRQEAIRELSENPKFLLDYESAVRRAFVDERKHPTRDDDTKKPGNTYKAGKIRFAGWMGFLMVLVPLMNLAVVIAILIGMIQPAWILVSFLVGYGITAGCKSKLDAETSGIFSSEMTSGQIYPIFQTIRDAEFSSEKLVSIRERVAGSDGMMIAQKKLSRLADMKNLDYNPVVGMLLTGFLGWDFFLAFLAMRWDREHGEAFAGSFDIVAEMEELGSLAVLSVVRPTVLPKLSGADDGQRSVGITFTDLAHPLLDPDTVVSNDGELASPLTVITGSNMSGKTTFLRTVAISLVLSYIGAGVVAEEFASDYRKLFTSMRVQDDVAGGISTFYAEILRVREMAEYIRKGEGIPALCLIDEIFKGTNSADRIVGAEEALKKLSVGGSMVIVSTHDFELCNLKQTSGEPADNRHFEESYADDKLVFDYKMKDGPCKTRNARALLHLAGLMDSE
ncbi:MAG: DNA mismatch repair protein MutS [Eubacterium sp.]|nr:DNA mismatch repair protein MutS [Eubacterium sp.]